jgi:DNA adenine methylase
VARRADRKAPLRQHEPTGSRPALREPAALYRTAEDFDPERPVNVAAVPQRSPFRYPGGKTWLVPYVRTWLLSLPQKPRLLVEPFAGGAIVGLTAAFERLAERVLLVEKDPDVSAVWRAILGGHAEWLARRVETFELTRQNVLDVLSRTPSSQRERAFATLLRNRVQRGGILAPGAGLVKQGENGQGLRSRWYPQTLARRIRAIATQRERICFVEGDGLEVMASYAERQDAAFFVDPPYTVAARRLYRFWDVDHRQLFRLARAVRGSVLMTYDRADEILALAEEFGLQTAAVAMKNTHHARMTELLVGKTLNWLPRARASGEWPAQSFQARLVFGPQGSARRPLVAVPHPQGPTETGRDAFHGVLWFSCATSPRPEL